MAIKKAKKKLSGTKPSIRKSVKKYRVPNRLKGKMSESEDCWDDDFKLPKN